MAVARNAVTVELPPDRAFALWSDVKRWPTFVDGFGHVDRLDDEWPARGAKVVWRSPPNGRGTVTERVVEEEEPTRLVVEVFEERLHGTQAATFAALEDGTRVELQLDYRLAQGGPLRAIADALFIRRAVSDSLGRTLRRFAVEAAEEASL